MSNKTLWPVYIIAIAVLVSVVMVASKPELATRPTATPLPNVSVMTVTPSARTLQIVAEGTVVPRTESNLIPEVSGRVVWKSPNFVTGGYIKLNEPLLKIDTADYEDALGLAQAALAKAEVEAELARAELSRLTQLFSKKLASQSQLDQARRTAKVSEASLQDAGIKLRQAERDLSRTTLLAPFAGRVRAESVDVGQFVARGETVGNAYATDYVEVRLPIVDSKLAFLNLPFGYSGNLDIDQQADVLVVGDYAGLQHQWRGRLVRTEAELDASSRMVYGVVKVENDESLNQVPLMVGMFVRATITGRTVDQVVELPRIALRENNRVLVLETDNILRFRDVTPLRIERDSVLISGGLNAGDRVCVSSMAFAVDGIKVNPLEKLPVDQPSQAMR